MNARLAPWAAMALLVLLLAVRSAVAPGSSAPGVTGPGTAAATPPGHPWPTAGGGPEIRLGQVDVRELRDDGTWNRLDAAGAVYGYANRTVTAESVAVFLGERSPFAGTTVRAPRAAWDLDGKTIGFPEGCRIARAGGWAGELTAATLDLAGKVLRVPGPARMEGPGVTVHGRNLAWNWADGKVTMESTSSRISPKSVPGRKE